eukprot:971509-Lingulodinium_polyedra.AAC.1
MDHSGPAGVLQGLRNRMAIFAQVPVDRSPASAADGGGLALLPKFVDVVPPFPVALGVVFCLGRQAA